MLARLKYQISQALIDVILASFALYLSYAIRFDFNIPPEDVEQVRNLILIVILIRLGALFYFGLYRRAWHYAGLADLISIFKAVTIGTALFIGVAFFRNYHIGLTLAVLFLIVALIRQRATKKVLSLAQSGDRGALAVATLVCMVMLYPVLNTVVSSFTHNPGSIRTWIGDYLLGPDFDMPRNVPRSIIALEWMLNILLIGGSRMVIRLSREYGGSRPSGMKKVLVVGAGDAGEQVVREMRRNRGLGYSPVGLMDDDPRKKGMRIHGVEVLGGREDIRRIADEKPIDEIVIAIPSLRGRRLGELIACCEVPGVRVQTVPGLADLINGKISVNEIREVQVEDLLERDEVEVDVDEISAYLTGKVVLVTGAGGSIASELCRQIAGYAPQRILLLGRGENSIYEIEMELRTRFPQLGVAPIIGNIRDAHKIDAIFEKYRPQIVFHAAAHKHVPLMEAHPEEAIKNNVLGTKNVALAAVKYGAERFVFISTDKAVNPTSVMGASKRVAELFIGKIALEGEVKFVIVRFGNVLGSRGSAIPLFKKQISLRGPVTITHPEMVRYFMTIPEAARLVIQSGAMGEGGEIFVLDMGKPIKILDMARNLIRLSGLEPDKDIKIEYTGLRPGEKLYEEILTAGEGIRATEHKKIFISRPEDMDYEKLLRGIEQLEVCSQKADRERILMTLKDLVPTYTPYDFSGA